MGSPDPADLGPRHRIRSISFDPGDAEWVDALVDLLRQAGYPKAARTEIVRAALQELHQVLAGRTRAEIVKFFLDREAERLLASFDGTPRLPFP
jgi:hypothetical protein